MPSLSREQEKPDINQLIETRPNLLNQLLIYYEGLAVHCSTLQKELEKEPDLEQERALNRYVSIFEERLGFSPFEFADVRARVNKKLEAERLEHEKNPPEPIDMD